MKNLTQFFFEEMNLIQIFKAITQWLIFLTLLYSAEKLTQIVNLLKELVILN